MSDATAAPAVTPESTAPATPTQAAHPVEAPPKPRTIDDDLEDVLKKHGGFEYGKDKKKVERAGDLRRMLGKVSATDSAAAEALKAKQEAEGLRRRFESLKTLRPVERMKALEEMVGPGLVREAAEEFLLDEHAKSEAQKNMSERERRLQADNDAKDAELARHRSESEKAEAQRKHAARVAQATQMTERLERLAVGALQKAKASPEVAAMVLPAIADRLDRNERLGIGTDEGELADLVVAEHDGIAASWLKGKDAPSLVDMLEASGKMPEVKAELKRRIRGTVAGATGPQVARVEPAKPQPSTKDELMSFWRSTS